MKVNSKKEREYIIDSEILDAIGLPPSDYDGPKIKINIRALDKYCKAKGISAEDLTEEELKQFELPVNSK